jgi:hypothetical protein
MDAMDELDSEDKGVLNQIKCWFFSHTQHLNFFTILVLASVSIHFMLHSFQYDLVFLYSISTAVCNYSEPKFSFNFTF